MATAQMRFSAADRREQILEVATLLFARQGFQGTKTKEVARHAGVTEALIFRHFPSKEALYWAVIERKITAAAPAERMREQLNADGGDFHLVAGSPAIDSANSSRPLPRVKGAGSPLQRMRKLRLGASSPGVFASPRIAT